MNALYNLSRKKSREVTASLPGRFLSRRCLTLCIKPVLNWANVCSPEHTSDTSTNYDLKLESQSSTNATTVVVENITGERGWKVALLQCKYFCRTKTHRTHDAHYLHAYIHTSMLAEVVRLGL